jgi:hypothetical protein
MTSKKKISEQVLYRINGGMQSVTAPVQQEDVWEALSQLINTLFKTQNFADTLQMGDTIPNGLLMATYEDITLVPITGGMKCYALLPITPVALPRNMGIYQISVYKDFRTLFIPLQAGQQFLLDGVVLINDLLGQVGYEVYGKKIVFTRDFTTYDANLKVHMRLVIFDLSQYGDTDILPIPADMETSIVDQLVQQFAPVQGKMKFSDIISQQPLNK